MRRRLLSTLAAVAATAVAQQAAAVEIEDVGGETLTVDISNTSELSYHFDNRNSTTSGQTLKPEEHVDDNYAEWQNRLYLRSYYWKLSLGVRLDSAVYMGSFDRQDAQDLIVEELGAPDLPLEERFGREIHSRYTSLIYPAKLWLGFKHKRFEATAGDFYANLGRGLVFSVRKMDEVGIDTTVRGGKIKMGGSFDDFRLEGSVFGGQLNPIRIDYPTGRVLHGSGSPLFFAFPTVSDFDYYAATGPDSYELQSERAKPSYLEDAVVGGNITLGPPWAQLELNGALLFRQANSEEQVRCLADGIDPDRCRADFPSFSVPEESRARDQIRNFSAALNLPGMGDAIDVYLEVAGQNQGQGRVSTIDADGNPVREQDLWGYAVYGNVNLHAGPLSTSIEAKHYRQFFPLGANIDNGDLAFGAREYSVVTYSRPPTAESIYVEQLGAPDVCVSGARTRIDASLSDDLRVYGWLGRFISYTEVDPNLVPDDPNDPQSDLTCTPSGRGPDGRDRTDSRRTGTWDTAAGGEIDLQDGKTHYWGWVGTRLTDRTLDAPGHPDIPGETSVFYREEYVRYDFNQHLSGDFSLSAVGNHRRRYEPDQLPEPWMEGENLLALNWAPHFSFIFGHEYQTRPGLPVHYFNGAIQYRSRSQDTWYDQLTDSVRLFVGQRRAALRCVGGVCRSYPAFEGARLELVSRF